MPVVSFYALETGLLNRGLRVFVGVGVFVAFESSGFRMTGCCEPNWFFRFGSWAFRHPRNIDGGPLPGE